MEDAKVAQQTGRTIMYENRVKKKRHDGLRNKESVTFFFYKHKVTRFSLSLSLT